MNGAIRSASHMTGIVPKQYRRMFCFENLSCRTFCPLSFFLRRCVNDLQKQAIHILRRMFLPDPIIAEVCKGADHQPLLILWERLLPADAL